MSLKSLAEIRRLVSVAVQQLRVCELSHLLGVVDEGIARVDKEDVLGLQVSVSQLVVMENCRCDRGEGEGCYQQIADDLI